MHTFLELYSHFITTDREADTQQGRKTSYFKPKINTAKLSVRDKDIFQHIDTFKIDLPQASSERTNKEYTSERRNVNPET